MSPLFVAAIALSGMRDVAWAYTLGESVLTLVVLASSAMALLAWRSTFGGERRFWLGVFVSGVLIAVSQLYYAYYVIVVDARGPVVPSPATWLDLAGAIVFVLVLMSFTRFRHASVAARIRYSLDVVALSFVTAVVTYMVLIDPWYEALGLDARAPRVLAACYPVIAGLIVNGVVCNLLGAHPSKWESWERLLAGGLGCLAAGLLLWPLWYASTAAGFGGRAGIVAPEALTGAGMLLILWATVDRRANRAVSWFAGHTGGVETTSGWSPTLVIPGIEIAAIPLFGVLSYRWRGYGAPGRLYALAMTAAVGLVVARTVLTVVDNAHLLDRAVTDPLTGLFNHRSMHSRLPSALEGAVRFHEPVSLVVMDVDDLRAVNVAGGHSAGDAVLVGVAKAVRGAVRRGDWVFRLGGDELAILLPETGIGDALAVARKALAAIRRVRLPDGRAATASLGLATFPVHATTVEDLLHRANGARYWAKYHGKDQAVVYDSAVVTALDAEERIRTLQEGMHLDAVRALAVAVDARSPGMEHHSRNVGALAVLFVRHLRMDERTANLIEVAALVHDVGKIGISDRILGKPGPLSADEMLLVREHSALGERILASTRFTEVLPWVRHHHERWDGRGYPDGIAGEDIPAEARIIALCDSYDAMTSDRAYRKAMSKAAALQEIDLNLGTQFDPHLGEEFIRAAVALDEI